MKKRADKQIKRAVWLIARETVLIAAALSMVFPFVYMFVSSGKTGVDLINKPFAMLPSWVNLKANYASVFSGEIMRPSGLALKMFAPYLTMLKNTLILVVTALVFVIVGSVPIGYALGCREFRFKKAYMLFLVFIQAVPLFGYLIAFYFMMDMLGFSNNLIGIGMIYAGVSAPGTVIFFRGFYAGFPREIEEAAEVDGASEFRRFFTIVVPLSRGIIMSIILVSFMGYWNEFAIANILITKPDLKTIPVNVMLTSSVGSSALPYTFALLVLSAVPTLLFFTVFQKYITEGGLSLGSLKG
jgi:N-acetylglucosamine transport system permease protein